jgi:reactive intermediate/imine deaminase
MPVQPISTPDAPRPIGTYSQAIRAGSLVFLSAQAPIDPATMEVVQGGFDDQIRRVLENLDAVIRAAGGSTADVAKITVFMTDLAHFPRVNEAMADYFKEPYPARAAVGVNELPRKTDVAIEAIMILPVTR